MEKIYFISKAASWQRYRFDVLNKLAENCNCKVEILTTGNAKSHLEGSNGVKYIKFFSLFPHKLKLSLFPGALFYLYNNRPDALLAISNISQWTELFALVLCKLLRIRFVWWTHGYPYNQSANYTLMEKIKQRIRTYSLHFGDAIIVFSKHGKEYLVEQNIRKNKIFIANNTLDTNKLYNAKKSVLSKYTEKIICKELDVPKNSYIILFIGRLKKTKRLENAIGAINILQDKYTNILFVIIGGGEELERYKDYKNSSHNPHIRFVGEVFDEEQIAKWCHISKLFLHPGAIGLSIVHAMIFGLPVITEEGIGNYGHGPEIQYLRNGYNGFMVPPNNVKKMAEIIEQLLINEKKREELSKNAESVIKEEATIESMVFSMAEALGLNMAAEKDKDNHCLK